MFPGLTTKVSEEVVALSTTIFPKADLVRVTNTAVTTVVSTISPAFGGGFSGLIFLMNDSGAAIQLATTGNINLTSVRNIPDEMMVPLIYSKLSGEWHVGAIS